MESDYDFNHPRKKIRPGSDNDDDDDLIMYEGSSVPNIFSHGSSVSHRQPSRGPGPNRRRMSIAPMEATPSYQQQSLQQQKGNARRQFIVDRQEEVAQRTMERAGVAAWRDWCVDERQSDGDLVTPEKLLEYIDQEVVPWELSQLQQWQMQQRAYADHGISSNFPVSGTEACVKPVLQLWQDQSMGAIRPTKHSRSISDPTAGWNSFEEQHGSQLLQELLGAIRALAWSSGIDLPSLSSGSGVRRRNWNNRIGGSNSNGALLTVLDKSFLRALHQSQQETRRDGSPGSLLTNPLLATVVESLLGFMRASSLRNRSGPSGSTADIQTPSTTISPSPQSPVVVKSASFPKPRQRAKSRTRAPKKSVDRSVTTSNNKRGRGTTPKPKVKASPENDLAPPAQLPKVISDCIPEMWHEWHHSWDGGVPMKDLIDKYGCSIVVEGTGFSSRMFYDRKRLMRAIEKTVESGALTLEEALERMENYRRGRKPSTLVGEIRNQCWMKCRNADHSGSESEESESSDGDKGEEEDATYRGTPVDSKNRTNTTPTTIVAAAMTMGTTGSTPTPISTKSTPPITESSSPAPQDTGALKSHPLTPVSSAEPRSTTPQDIVKKEPSPFRLAHDATLVSRDQSPVTETHQDNDREATADHDSIGRLRSPSPSSSSTIATDFSALRKIKQEVVE
ncbi:hypothetical protein BGX34_011440 [Mortierella sp. NVP85]|nr:hypothetical protein BGX34_011440 [Mortierella sp. NVP85]